MMRVTTSNIRTALTLFMLLGGALPLAIGSLEFSAGRVHSVFAEGNEQTVLQDNAVVENENIRVSAQTIRLSGDDNRYISGDGSISLFDKESSTELKAEVFSYDSEEDILILEGNSQFEDEKEDILIYSTFLERQPDLVVFQLNVQIIREDMLATAEYVRYFEDTKRLELSGFPVVHYQNDEYSASVIVVYTETNEIILEGEVKGQISEEEEETVAPPEETLPEETVPEDEGAEPSSEEDAEPSEEAPEAPGGEDLTEG